MRTKTWILLTVSLLLSPAIANAQYIYTYTGADFDTFGQAGGPPDLDGPNPYTSSDRLTIQLVTSAPLAANMTPPTIGAGTFQGVALVSLTVSDGVQSARYTAANIANASTLPFSTNITGYLVTNGAGAITGSALAGQTDSATHQFLWTDNDTLTPMSARGDYASDAPHSPMGDYFSASTSNLGKWTFTMAPELAPTSAAAGLVLLLASLAMASGAKKHGGPRKNPRI